MGRTKKRPRVVKSLTMEAFCIRQRSKVVSSDSPAQVEHANSPDHSENLSSKVTVIISAEKHGPGRKTDDTFSNSNGSKLTSGASTLHSWGRKKQVRRKTHTERNRSTLPSLQGASRRACVVDEQKNDSKLCQETLQKPCRKSSNARRKQEEQTVIDSQQSKVLGEMQNIHELITQNRLTLCHGLFGQPVESQEVKRSLAKAAAKPSEKRGSVGKTKHKSPGSPPLQSKPQVIDELIKSPSEFEQMEPVAHSTPLSSASDRASLCSVQSSRLSTGHAESSAKRNSKAREESATDETETKTHFPAKSFRSHTGLVKNKKKNQRHKHMATPELTRGKEKRSCSPKETGRAYNEFRDGGQMDTATVMRKAAEIFHEYVDPITFFPGRCLAVEHAHHLLSCLCFPSRGVEDPRVAQGQTHVPSMAASPARVMEGPRSPDGAPPHGVPWQRGFIEEERTTHASYQMLNTNEDRYQLETEPFMCDRPTSPCLLNTFLFPAAAREPAVIVSPLPDFSLAFGANFQHADIAAAGESFGNIPHFRRPAAAAGICPRECAQHPANPNVSHQLEAVRCDNYSRWSSTGTHHPEALFARNDQPSTSGGHFFAVADNFQVNVARQPGHAGPSDQFSSSAEFAYEGHDMQGFLRILPRRHVGPESPRNEEWFDHRVGAGRQASHQPKPAMALTVHQLIPSARESSPEGWKYPRLRMF